MFERLFNEIDTLVLQSVQAIQNNDFKQEETVTIRQVEVALPLPPPPPGPQTHSSDFARARRRRSRRRGPPRQPLGDYR